MSLKGKFKNKPYLFKFMFLIVLIFLSVSIFTIISYSAIMILFNISFSEINLFLNNISNIKVINSLKVLQGTTAISLFVIPSLIFCYLCDIKLKLNKRLNFYAILIGVTIILVINPFINYLYQLNQSIELPNWMYIYENKAEVLTEAFLHMNNISDLFINIIVIAFIAAFAEELFFRGLLQKTLIQYSNNNISILITAFLFSAVHMQFQGFLPRFTLGLLLGYIFYWSKNLWIPIIMHFMNNAVVILLHYNPIQKLTNINPLDFNEKSNYQEVFFSVLAVSILLFLFRKKTRSII